MQRVVTQDPALRTTQVTLAPVRLARGRTIEGRIVDENGSPIAGAAVLASDVEQQLEARLVTSGPGGAFRVTGLPDGALRLRALDFVGHREALVDPVSTQNPHGDVAIGDVVLRSHPVDRDE
jgi:hypothetical protein